MEITKEQKEAIEYLEKYTKWETYGERNLEKDIITVLELLRDLYNDNIRYEKELHNTLKYSISKEKIKKVIKEKEWALENYDCDKSDYKQSQVIGAWDILQKLLKEREE